MTGISRVSETPIAGRIGIVASPEPEDDLGDLMVMTDDEGDTDDEGGRVIGLVPETPAK
jgi:hypothetical protein